MKLPTATTVLAIFLASVSFTTAVAVPDAIAEPVLESMVTFHHYTRAIADNISLQGVALASALRALVHFSAAASQQLGAMDLWVLLARQPVNGLEL